MQRVSFLWPQRSDVGICSVLLTARERIGVTFKPEQFERVADWRTSCLQPLPLTHLHQTQTTSLARKAEEERRAGGRHRKQPPGVHGCRSAWENFQQSEGPWSGGHQTVAPAFSGEFWRAFPSTLRLYTNAGRTAPLSPVCSGIRSSSTCRRLLAAGFEEKSR